MVIPRELTTEEAIGLISPVRPGSARDISNASRWQGIEPWSIR
jgi:hypothetical protein